MRQSAKIGIVLVGAFLVALTLFMESGGGATADVTVTVKAQAPGKADRKPDLDEAELAEGGETGVVTGVVRVTGDIPALPALVAKAAAIKDAAVCAAAAIPDESFVVDAKGGLKNVFVYLETPPAGAAVPPPPVAPLLFDQVGCRFLPHAMVVRVGQPVQLVSGDPIAHNTHLFPLRNQGVNVLIKPLDRVGVEHIYTRPERLPIQVKCDIHAWMLGYHLPLDHPFGAVTLKDGTFTIRDLPPGTHKFRVWHERVGFLERGLDRKVEAGKPTKIELDYPVKKFFE